MEISGLPLHPLVVHAAVVLTPLAVLAAAAHAVWPAGRWVLRWVAPLLALAALGAVLLATSSGEELLEARPFLLTAESPVADLVREHQELGDQLELLLLGLVGVVVAGWWVLPARSPLGSGRGGHAGHGGGWLHRATAAAVLVLGAACLVWVVRTGEAGARAVWGL